MRHTLCAIVVAVLVPAAGFAQPAASNRTDPYDQVLSTNPLGTSRSGSTPSTNGSSARR